MAVHASKFRLDQSFNSSGMLGIHLNEKCLIFIVTGPGKLLPLYEEIAPYRLGIEQVLRLLSALFGKGYIYIVGRGEGTRLPNTYYKGQCVHNTKLGGVSRSSVLACFRLMFSFIIWLSTSH